MKTEIEVIFEMAKEASKKDEEIERLREEIERLREEIKDLEAVVRLNTMSARTSAINWGGRRMSNEKELGDER